MFYHLGFVSASINVVNQTDETDCLIIALGCTILCNQNLQSCRR